MENIKVLHITRDDKFFDSVFEKFKKVPHFENSAVLEVKKKEGFVFRRIKNTEMVNLVEKKEFRKILREGEYDILFFYSISQEQYMSFRWIPKDKIVIWWCWGMEIYQPVFGLPPLIDLPLYKPLTQRLLLEKSGRFFPKLKSIIKTCLIAPRYKVLQKKVLKRIDFFQPVLPLEYKLMCGIQGFRAKEFYYPQSHGLDKVNVDTIKPNDGSVLMGNSQSPTNNHLDVWESINNYLPDNRKVYIPINYLGDQEYAGEISKKIKSDRHELYFIREFMPSKDYFGLINRCSYAVFGVIRQQAMGNIFYCISHGLKLFLYRDSIVYRFLKEKGFVVFAIDEIDEQSFSQALTKSENEQNAKTYEEVRLYKEEVWKKALDEILSIKKTSF